MDNEVFFTLLYIFLFFSAIQGYQQPGAKTQIANIIYSVKLAKIPLIFLNIICIGVKLIW